MTGRSLGRLWKGSGTPKKNWAKVEQVFPLPPHSPCDKHHPDAPDASGRVMSWSWSYHDWLPIMQGSNLLSRHGWMGGHRNPFRFGRHYYITKVSCVSPQKPLPPIDGFQRSSSDSSLPEFATWDDRKNNRKLFSNRSHPLAEDQVLKSTGMCLFVSRQKSHSFFQVIRSHLVLSKLSQLWSLAMVSLTKRVEILILSPGRSNGFIDRPVEGFSYAFSSAFLRINPAGQLVGQHMDEIGISNLRMGRQLSYI